jgi:hypothetical protein
LGFRMKRDIVIVSTRVMSLKHNLAYYLEQVAVLRSDKTAKEAWEAIEAEIENAGFDPRYTSYESYRAGASQYYTRVKRK